MKSGHLELYPPYFHRLDRRELDRIHEASLRILSRVGVKVDGTEAIELLHGAGADVSDPARVRIPEALVEKALETVPHTVVLHKRDGTPLSNCRAEAVLSGTPDQPDILDPRDGRRRPCRIADVEANARLIDALPNLTWSFTSEWAGYPQGFPAVLAGKVSFMIQLVTATSRSDRRSPTCRISGTSSRHAHWSPEDTRNCAAVPSSSDRWNRSVRWSMVETRWRRVSCLQNTDCPTWSTPCRWQAPPPRHLRRNTGCDECRDPEPSHNHPAQTRARR